MLVHLGQRRRRLGKPRLLGKADQRIGADPVLGCVVAIEVGKAQDILRTRVAASGGGVNERHGLASFAPLEQQQAVIVGSPEMALVRGQFVISLGLFEILVDASAQLVGLAEVELRIGVAAIRRAFPFADRGLVVARRPSIHACLDVCDGRSSSKKNRASHQ